MSSTDHSFSDSQGPIETQRPSLRERWWHIMDTWKIGIIPLPLFVLAGVLIAIDCLGGKLPSDIVVMVATLAFFGFACGEFGEGQLMPNRAYADTDVSQVCLWLYW